MAKVYKVLADMDFGMVLANANYQTQIGKELVEKYQSFCMANSPSCTTVNAFLNEARTLLYDKGIQSVYENLLTQIGANKYGWMLATACESIENDGTRFNFINKRAAQKVRQLLEMNEEDIVTYVKAGALKDCMYCEAFRNIKNAIARDIPVVEHHENFTITHPFSIVEKREDKAYFVVNGMIYKVNESTIETASVDEVSHEFVEIAKFLESRDVTFCNETQTLSFQYGSDVWKINEAGKCVKVNKEGKETEYTTETLRNQNRVFVNSVFPTQRGRVAMAMEALAKTVENFDSIAILNNVSIVESANDRCLVIETKEGNLFAALLNSNHSSAWNINENAYEVVNFIKSKTFIDLKEQYKDRIMSAIDHVRENEAESIRESLKEDKMTDIKHRIAELTEQFKNKPAQLAILSELASKLSKGEVDMEA